MAEGTPDFENQKRPPKAEEKLGRWMREKWFELSGNEEPPVKEVTSAKETLLTGEEYAGPQLTEDQKSRRAFLKEGAERAVQIKEFAARNKEFAKTVAHTAALSFKLLHEGDSRVPSVEKLEKFFYEAALKAGEKFKDAFDPKTGEYYGVKSLIAQGAGEATEVNREMMKKIPDLLKTSLKNPDDAWQVARRAGFRDAAATFANATGMAIPKEALTRDDEAIRRGIKNKTKKDDMWGIEMVDTMPMRANFEGTISGEFTDELLMYDLVESLANATFIQGQIHRAYAGDKNRINPEVKLNFNPRDVMLREKYWEALKVNPGEDDGTNALYRVMFEQRKDIHEVLADKKDEVRGVVGAARLLEPRVQDLVPFIVTPDALKNEGREVLEKRILEKMLDVRVKLQEEIKGNIVELEKKVREADHIQDSIDEALIARNFHTANIEELEPEGVSERIDIQRAKLSKAIESLLALEEQKKKVGTSFSSRREKNAIENTVTVLGNEELFKEVLEPIIRNAVSYHIDRIEKKK